MAISADIKRRLGDLPVGRKLFAAFTTMVALLLIVPIGLFGTVTKLQRADHTVTDLTGARLAASEDIRYNASELRSAQHAYLLDGGDSRAAFESATRNFEVALQNLRDRMAGPAEQALAEKIATGYQTFLQVDQLIWGSVQAGDTIKAKNLSLGAEGLDFGFISADAESLAQIARAQHAAERAAAGDLDAEVGIATADETGRLARAFDAMLGNLRHREPLLRIDHRRQELDGQVHRALEMADDEADAIDVVGRTLAEVAPGKSAELLLADSSKSHLVQAAVSGPDPLGPACSVESPFACTAVRNGHTMAFESSMALDACPKLRARAIGACSAVCVPITFMVRAIGVLHAVGAEDETANEETITGLEMLSTQAGARIGMLRSIVKTQVQATTDGLTGMLNRRTFETRVRAMHREGVPFMLVMADLDHFKQLNDTFGHEAGDPSPTCICRGREERNARQ